MAPTGGEGGNAKQPFARKEVLDKETQSRARAVITSP